MNLNGNGEADGRSCMCITVRQDVNLSKSAVVFFNVKKMVTCSLLRHSNVRLYSFTGVDPAQANEAKQSTDAEYGSLPAV